MGHFQGKSAALEKITVREIVIQVAKNGGSQCGPSVASTVDLSSPFAGIQNLNPSFIACVI